MFCVCFVLLFSLNLGYGFRQCTWPARTLVFVKKFAQTYTPHLFLVNPERASIPPSPGGLHVSLVRLYMYYSHCTKHLSGKQTICTLLQTKEEHLPFSCCYHWLRFASVLLQVPKQKGLNICEWMIQWLFSECLQETWLVLKLHNTQSSMDW